MKQLLVGTGNPGKAKEIIEALEEISGDFAFVTLKDFPPIADVEEDGKTFEANATLKAKYFGTALGVPTIADDSGFVLEAFPDRFGIRTRREIDEKDDMGWLTKFLEIIEPLENRRATFYCAMAYFDPNTGTEEVFLGTTAGEMMEFPQTPLEPGIPVSSVFLPDGSDEVYSALTKHQKNEISHRGKACALLIDFLKANGK